MATTYLKSASKKAEAGDESTRSAVQGILANIESGREVAAREYARELDGWDDEIVVSEDVIQNAERRLPETVKDDIRFAHARVRELALHQRDSQREFEVPLIDGLVVGQRLIPVSTAGCYVPGGRYAHAASAIMTCCTAKVAGVEHIIAT